MVAVDSIYCFITDRYVALYRLAEKNLFYRRVCIKCNKTKQLKSSLKFSARRYHADKKHKSL